MGRLVLKSKHRLACCDATDAQAVARLMGDGMADCVFTSPPYGVGIDYGATYQDTIENLRAMLPKLAAVWFNLLVAGGYAVVNFNDVASGAKITKSNEGPCEYPMSLEYWPIFRAAGFALWSRRIWCKPTARVNSPWCIQSNRGAADWEHIWTWKKPGESIVRQTSGKYASQSGWFDTSAMEGVDVGKDTHGAGMPVSTAAWMINVHSLVGGIVHESFAGSGTTIIACEQLDRRCMACEISPAYCDVAVARYEAFTQTKAVRWDG